MAIDYVIDLDCRLKARLGVRGLVQHLKHCMILELAELCAEASAPRSLAVVGRGDALGVGSIPPSTVSLMREVDALAEYRDDCAACPANAFPGRRWGVGGCVGFITVPLESTCEDLMAEFLEQALDLPDGHPHPVWLDGIVACRERNLGRWRALRGIHAHGEPEYFERPVAIPVHIGAALGGGTLTTDALWAYLFEVGAETPLGAACAAQLCSDFGTHLGARLSWARVHILLRDSRSIEEILEYGGALARANSLGATAHVSV